LLGRGDPKLDHIVEQLLKPQATTAVQFVSAHRSTSDVDLVTDSLGGRDTPIKVERPSANFGTGPALDYTAEVQMSLQFH